MAEEDRFVEVTNDDGTVQTLKILTIIPKSEEFNKEYIILEDMEANEDGVVGYYPYSFEAENEDDGNLTPVETEEELAMIDGVVDAIDDIDE
ncbi:hypothetical protein RD055328_00210 [Companilactobacillus sp. RD055328]|uniref:DUF1292 domain-containing protein n=1 Tax=Companilactobacillus sp. RD055328 TaxID=2916634 RepID=UPI001FC8C5B9|nr:DUF1292 domain-containing protein [Companilactobacillus sp. RD055328]GKQ42098.1 hypothetical protein RD055328_00210 [Companilactobacillus sp. RD055328]